MDKSPSKKLIYVEWSDSHMRSGWENLNDFVADTATVKSVGWLVYETKETISICSNIGEETQSTLNQGNGIMTIPKNCITKKKQLKISG